MNRIITDLPPPVNHVFVDFENVHEVDHAVFGSKAVHLTLLLGARQTKLDVSLVEKLLEHAAAVQLVRLGSSGRNALDFTLAYYVGRAVAADPTGFFHIVSKDAGYDPLIEHRRSKHIRAHRHNDFTKLSFSSPAKVPPSSLPVAAPDLKSKSKPKSQKPRLEEWETRVLEHFSRASTTRPRSQKKLISYLIAFFGQKITEAEALDRIERLSQAGQLVINEKGVVTYHMERE